MSDMDFVGANDMFLGEMGGHMSHEEEQTNKKLLLQQGCFGLSDV